MGSVGVIGGGVGGRNAAEGKERFTLSSSVTLVGGGVGGLRSFNSSWILLSSLAFLENFLANRWILYKKN